MSELFNYFAMAKIWEATLSTCLFFFIFKSPESTAYCVWVTRWKRVFLFSEGLFWLTAWRSVADFFFFSLCFFSWQLLFFSTLSLWRLLKLSFVPLRLLYFFFFISGLRDVFFSLPARIPFFCFVFCLHDCLAAERHVLECISRHTDGCSSHILTYCMRDCEPHERTF